MAVQGSPDGVIVAFSVDPQRTATLKGFVARWRVKPADGDSASWSTLPPIAPTARQAVTPPVPGAQHQPGDVDAQVIVEVELWSVLTTGESSPATDVEVIIVQGVPSVGHFQAVGAARTAQDGSSYPVLQITADEITAGDVQDLVVEVQPHGAAPEAWVSAGHPLPAANPNGDYLGFAGGAVLDVRARWRNAGGWFGLWDVQPGPVTIPTGALVSASTASVGDDATIGAELKRVADLLAQINAIQANIDALTNANYTGSIAALHDALYGSDGKGGLNAQLNTLVAGLKPNGSTYNGILGAAAASASSTYATQNTVSGLVSEIGTPGDTADKTGTLFARIAYAQSTMVDLTGYAKTTDVQQQISAIVPKPNVVRNGAFGAVATLAGAPVVASWSLAGDWAPFSGDAVYRTILRSTAAPGSGLGPVVLSDFYPVNPGQPYSGQAAALGGLNSAGRIELHFQWWNGATQLPDSVLSIQPTGTWAVYTLPNVTAPSNATRGRVAVVLANVTSNAFGVGVTRVKLEQSTYCTPFTDDALSASFSQLIQTNADALAGKAGTDVVTALSASVGTLTGQVGDPAKPAAGSLFAGLNEVRSVLADIPAGESLSQFVQGLSASTPAGNPNLVPNADLGVVGSNGAPLNWSAGGASFNPNDPNERGVFFHTGNSSPNPLSDFFQVTPSGQYSLAAMLANSDTAGALTRATIQWWTSSATAPGSFIGYSPSASVGPGGFRYASAAGFFAPSNAGWARISYDKANYSAGGTAGWTRAKVEAGPVNTAFSDEALTAAVNTTATALTQLSGYATANYTVGVDANGVWTGLKLLSAGGGSTQPISSAIFYADIFAIRTRSGAQLTFTDYQGGTLTVPNLIVGTRNLGAGAVTSRYVALTQSQFYLPCASPGATAPTTTTTPPTSTGGNGGGGGTGGKIVSP